MRNFLAIVTLATMTFFTACGGGGSGDSANSSSSTSVSMAIGKAYAMSSGQTIKKESQPTEIFLETDVNTGETQATLTSGSASIVTN